MDCCVDMQWLASHPKFIANPVYIAGDSYSGLPLPIVVKYISDGNFMPSVIIYENSHMFRNQL